MAREQLGVCAEANLHGDFLLLNAIDGQEVFLRQQLAQIPALVSQLADHFSEAMLTGVVAIGASYWDTLYPEARPAGLLPFPVLESSELLMPASAFDLLLQIRSDRQDVNYLVAQQLYQLLAPAVELVEQMRGFRYLDGRDLTGFIDAPEAVRGRKRRELALLTTAQEPQFAAGSYLHLQRFRHDLKRWQLLPVSAQQAIIGRNKSDGQWLPLVQLEADCHSLCFFQDKNRNQPLPLLTQNMPFADLKQQGLLWLSYSSDSTAFETFIRQRLGVGELQADGYDRLLDYCQADLGAAFFAPSVSFLEQYERR
ncbi:Dyp-type peroxidase [Alkalimonas mucilaginosa]|uniref:Dyp-type peroxidase n=1 Tax=Alkalimonas mucilaginosa TaxID=3057676 RepID=A0ABU7JC05_9GAMM|nr:Dyp-type peroxidase [Alkalimonas sp. MEB004]MEE2023190.1 Dyp-type peroxidase [Alkalimonas sp. MEB004]